MGEHSKNKPADADVTVDNAYQLDLDEHSNEDLEGAFEDAVAAVEGRPAAAQLAAAKGEIADLEERLGKAEAEGKALRDRLARTLADFDNFRKRTEREKQELERTGISGLAKDFLGVVDNLERAMASSGAIEDLKHGLELVQRQYGDILRRHGVQELEVMGQPFDPAVHEAVGSQESEEVDVPTVLAEMQKGYMLYDRLLRPAMVLVALPKAKAEPESDDGADDVAEELERAVD